MDTPFSILALDFHNTVYDEVMEFGLAIDAAVDVWAAAAEYQGQPLNRQQLHDELSVAHRELGSDWDEDVWLHLPSLRNLRLDPPLFTGILHRAVNARHAKSRDLTINGAFDNTVETLNALKSRGVRLYIITEAAADAGMRGISWLGLDGVINGVYTWPSRHEPVKPANTFHRIFPGCTENPEEHRKKPHPLLLAAVALDDAKNFANIPVSVELRDVFDITHDDALVLPEFPISAALQKEVAARLFIKPGPYNSALRETLDSMLYVGDSKFKDGFLARNAGVKFGFAAYGKKVRPGDEALFARSREILYAVTGWEKDALKLTQESESSAAVSTLRPDFTFETSLAEALPLFI